MHYKRETYYENECSPIPITKTNITRHKEKQFDFSRISQIDQLLNKNEKIYINLRKKLEDISVAERNITNNINVIRPISYGTRERELEALQNEKFFNDSNSYYRTINFDNFASSPIQTERQMNQSMRKRIQSCNRNMLIISQDSNANTSLEQQSSLRQSKPSQSQNFKRTNISQQQAIIQQPFNRKNISTEESIGLNSMNMTKTTQNNPSYNILPDSSSFLDKENFYFMNRSYEPLYDSLIKMNFGELNKRKEEIQNIYQQLKKEEEQIQSSYQEYKKSFTTLHQTSTKKEESSVKSPPKKLSPKKYFDRKSSPSAHPSKMSTISKMNESNVNIKQSTNSLENTTRTLNIQRNQSSRNVSKPQNSPVKMSMVKYCTQEFQTAQIPNKPQPMTARSHVFVPFNKLYKSPIMQMKNKNTLILARQSKVLPQKTAQHKIIDGKKYKFSQSVQTDEQQLIKNVLVHDHNTIAIVGGQQTLKKKLHMSLIAHSFDRMLKIINSQQHNCLSLNLSYHEYIEKSQNQATKINNSVEINQEISIKLAILQIGKTIQQIYDAIKRPTHSVESTGMNKTAFQLTKDKTKVVKFTKLSLLSGKDYVWTCHILSANQISFEFLKNLEVKDIIWSINPLIKNYDEVAKTLNEATKYIEAKADI